MHWLSNITAVAATAFLLATLTHAYRADRPDRTSGTAHDRGGPAGSETTCPSCLRPPGRDGRPAGPPTFVRPSGTVAVDAPSGVRARRRVVSALPVVGAGRMTGWMIDHGELLAAALLLAIAFVVVVRLADGPRP